MASPCCVQYCTNIGTHFFPKNEVRKTQWIQAIKYKHVIRKTSRICSAHFRPADFVVTPTSFTKLDRAPKILKRNAVPSIFPWNREHNRVSQELIFDPSKAQATYSRTPPIQYVATFPFLDTKTEDSLDLDPLQLPDQEIEFLQSDPDDQNQTVQHNREDSPHLSFNQDDDIIVEIESGKSVQSQTDLDHINEKHVISTETQTLGIL